ncbi:MAG: efflux RND transporter periplasmic adaptor subunit [Acidobacteria bacterium]|nr:efflux RND transporter periplasmic adaptor subunit [Acidobacteriota bacterium]MBI3426738.1 efflux RND transporter periplasmic adaptor subunit [Acidobacteriota bacterium]
MQPDLNSLRIDKSLKTSTQPPGVAGISRWAKWWIIGGVLLFVLLGAARFIYSRANAALEVEVARATKTTSNATNTGSVILSATGYIVAHHKIQVASKVVGKVAWIGVEKGNRVQQGQVIARLEDDEYRAQLQQSKGKLAALEARLLELNNGSRPEEIEVARANLERERADLANAKISLDRMQQLLKDQVMSQQNYDDAKSRYDAQAARVNSLEKTFQLVKIGPRQEQLAQVRGEIEQVKGEVAFAETQLANTIIRAPIRGTILERIVERGEFVTTGFVGDRGAKGYVVSMADLDDLQVELDIVQTDFAKLGPRQRGTIRTDAYRDRSYQGYIEEIAPEANRQKATVQVKVKVENPDGDLRPDMNASVDFIADAPTANAVKEPAKPAVYVPATAVRDGAVFVHLNGQAVRRVIKTGATTSQGVRVEEGLIGGEEVILNPPAELKDGGKVKIK